MIHLTNYLKAGNGGVRTALFVLAILAATVLPATPAMAAGGFTFATDKTTYRVGDTVTVSVRVNTGSEPTNAVAANFTYPANLLQYLSSDATGSAFPVAAAEKGGNGSVSYQRGAYTPVTGDKLVQKATFRVLAAGTANLKYDSSSMAISSEDNETNVATGLGSATLTLAAPVTTGPTPAPTPSPAPAPAPAPKPAPAPVAPRRPVTTVTPVTPQGNAQPIPLAENETIEVATPVDIQPATIKPDGISKIEYSLNDKLIKTVNVAPYKYRVDTTKMLNGKYKLTTKTYYSNGQTETVNQTLIVKNAFSLTQLKLRLQSLIGLIVLGFVLILGAIAVWVLRRNRASGGPNNQGGGYIGGSGNTPVAAQPDYPDTVIVPSDDKIRF